MLIYIHMWDNSIVHIQFLIFCQNLSIFSDVIVLMSYLTFSVWIWFIWAFFLSWKFQESGWHSSIKCISSSPCKNALTSAGDHCPRHLNSPLPIKKADWSLLTCSFILQSHSLFLEGKTNTSYTWCPSASCLELKNCTEGHVGQFWQWSISPGEPLEVSPKRIWSRTGSLS